MENRDFAVEVVRLRNGEIKELIVQQPEFLAFRDVWLQLEDRSSFVGEAGLSGKIIYRYVQENK